MIAKYGKAADWARTVTGIQFAKYLKSEVRKMKLTIKFVPILVLLLLASPLILLKGCGKAMNGGPSGACPDTVAPNGSQINVATLSGPLIGNPSCYPAITIQVIGPDGVEPMNGVCVAVTALSQSSSGGTVGIALVTQKEPNICNNVGSNPQKQIVTRTDDTGSVILEMLTSAATGSGDTYSLQVSSGPLAVVAITAAAAP